VTIWNRTPSKTNALVRLGASGRGTAAEAFQASAVSILCLSDYAATRTLLAKSPELGERTVVQLATGTPREAETMYERVAAVGGDYLDGAVLGGPGAIGTKAGRIALAGKSTTFERCSPVLQFLGGGVFHVGEAPGAAAALDLAWLCQRFGLFLGLSHSVRLCQAQGLDLRHLASMFPEGDRSRLFVDVVAKETFDHPDATLAVWNGALDRVIEATRDAGLEGAIPALASRLLREAIRLGHGAENIAAVSKVSI
jgi:3-hydroxyisobutyrate dehydrogenase-like beta-hydroxyacid dehydrogenase